MLDSERGLQVRQFFSQEEMERVHDAERAICNIVVDTSVVKLSMRALAFYAAGKHNVHMTELLGAGKRKKLCHARFEAWALTYQARSECDAKKYSLTQIADYYGRDHTTVMHGIQRAYELGLVKRKGDKE